MDKLPTINRSLDDFVKLTPLSSGKNFGGVSYRFNNVTVDGASFNNSFGLASALGASGTEPISLEALEQVQVMIAPFDAVSYTHLVTRSLWTLSSKCKRNL